MRRALAGEILARLERRGLELRAARLLTVDRSLARGALRRAHREAVLRRARRLHHVGAHTRARRRRGGSDRGRPDDDGRDEPGGGRPGHRSAATLALSMPDNLVHGSGRPESAEREIRALVPRCRSLTTRRNREVWTKANADYTDAQARGIGRREIEWGCGPSPSRAERARRRRRQGRGRARLRHRVLLGMAREARGAAGRRRHHAGPARDRAADAGGDRDRVPAHRGRRGGRPLPDASFDLALSEYGASIWADPGQWIPRRTGCFGPAASSSSSATRRSRSSACLTRGTSRNVLRPLASSRRMEWPGEDEGVEFHLGHGDMLGCCATAASRSKGSGSSARRIRDRPRVLRLRPAEWGRGSGRPRSSGRRASA